MYVNATVTTKQIQVSFHPTTNEIYDSIHVYFDSAAYISMKPDEASRLRDELDGAINAAAAAAANSNQRKEP
jgi:hypothetical protein